MGLAVGAIGTALAAVVSAFLGLPVWRMPLVVVVGAVLVISGPSMLLAWLKLRQRNLGRCSTPTAGRSAARARISIPFGGALTGVAAAAAGRIARAHRSVCREEDAVEELALPRAADRGGGRAWQQGYLDRFLG